MSEQLAHRQVGHQTPLMENRNAIAEFLSERKLVRGEDDGLALLVREPRDPVFDCARGLHIQPQGRLVKEQNGRVGDQSRGDRHLLLHPAREAAHGLVPPLPEVE